jgi:hypothetical protein
MQPINIIVAVDSIAALSKGTLEENVYLTDDNPLSQGKATATLTTVCAPGQWLHWKAIAVDVQSPAVIAGIDFLPHDDAPEESGVDPNVWRYVVPRWRLWTGLIPLCTPAGRYRYRLALQMGSGAQSVISINSPSIEVRR